MRAKEINTWSVTQVNRNKDWINAGGSLNINEQGN